MLLKEWFFFGGFLKREKRDALRMSFIKTNPTLTNRSLNSVNTLSRSSTSHSLLFWKQCEGKIVCNFGITWNNAYNTVSTRTPLRNLFSNQKYFAKIIVFVSTYGTHHTQNTPSILIYQNKHTILFFFYRFRLRFTHTAHISFRFQRHYKSVTHTLSIISTDLWHSMPI